MNKPLPLMSVIIPVCNEASLMQIAIDCALAMTYPNVEFIVINDGTADDEEAERIVLSYGDNIRYFPRMDDYIDFKYSHFLKQNELDYTGQATQNLIRETAILLYDTSEMYKNLLAEATSENKTGSFLMKTTVFNKKRPLRRLAVTFVRRCFGFFKKIIMALGLQQWAVSTKTYKRFKLRGTIDKLNRK